MHGTTAIVLVFSFYLRFFDHKYLACKLCVDIQSESIRFDKWRRARKSY